MEIQSLIGLIIGVMAIVGGQFLEGGSVQALLNLPAFLIVFGGTLGAVILGTPLSVFTHSLHQLYWLIIPPKFNTEAGIEKIIQWSQTARREGLLGLEPTLYNEYDAFSKKALQLLVDGTEPHAIRNVLECEILNKEDHDMQGVGVYEGMGGYSPTFGILGAVIGLIQVVGNLTDPAELGAGIAVAFVATVYGVGFANIVYIPVSCKIRQIIRVETNYREMLTEGVVSIAEGENPNNIQLKLEGFLVDKKKQV